MTTPPSEAQTPGAPRQWKRLRRWGRRLVAACALLLTLYLFRAPLLRATAGFLIVDDGPSARDGVLVYTGDQRFDRAASLLGSGDVRQVFLMRQYPDRLHRLGILPDDIEVDTRALLQRGVGRAAVAVLPGEVFDDWDMARGVHDWLDNHPAARLGILCDGFDSRRLAFVLHQVLGQRAGQVYLWPLTDRRYDTQDWWMSTSGVRAVADAYLRLGHAWWYGEDAKDEWREYDFASYKP